MAAGSQRDVYDICVSAWNMAGQHGRYGDTVGHATRFHVAVDSSTLKESRVGGWSGIAVIGDHDRFSGMRLQLYSQYACNLCNLTGAFDDETGRKKYKNALSAVFVGRISDPGGA